MSCDPDVQLAHYFFFFSVLNWQFYKEPNTHFALYLVEFIRFSRSHDVIALHPQYM